jgi:hypothetical protein
MGNKSSSEADSKHLQELRAAHADANAELKKIESEIERIRKQLEDTNEMISKISDQEEEINKERQELLMECYDGFTHPCIAAVERWDHVGAPPVVIPPALLRRLKRSGTVEGAGEEREETSPTSVPPPLPQKEGDVTHMAGEGEGEGGRVAEGLKGEGTEMKPVITYPPVPENDIVAYHKLQIQRRYLDEQFGGVLQRLRQSTEIAEGNVFKLELKLIRAQENERRAADDVNRLAGEVEAEQRRLEVVKSGKRKPTVASKYPPSAADEAEESAPLEITTGSPAMGNATQTQQPHRSSSEVVSNSREESGVETESGNEEEGSHDLKLSIASPKKGKEEGGA